MKPGTGERLGDAQTSSSHRRVDHVLFRLPPARALQQETSLRDLCCECMRRTGRRVLIFHPQFPHPLPRMFKPYGIEAYRTRARINEICILFTIAVCRRGRDCYRIHPKIQTFTVASYKTNLLCLCFARTGTHQCLARRVMRTRQLKRDLRQSVSERRWSKKGWRKTTKKTHHQRTTTSLPLRPAITSL
ncbi:hypothetical protein BKA70DRAFT_201490 [Coprinopsis sp. MPI-PUGE-AT-0042]|nr:hypothetical protein BKA70DRAFT_201490 [Coprinopsis sp. MPI-PUGE-AT-0042]